MKHYRLTNGMRVVIETIPTCRSVSFGIWVKTGSRSETRENNGISHFIEHMLFKGTDRFSAKDIADYFDGIGGMINAFTAKEYTCYYTKVLDDHLPGAVEYLASMYFDSTFNEEDMEKEKNVVLEEISMYEDTPDDLVHDLLAEACYGNHSLGFPILGTERNLKSFTPNDLRQYMNNFYTVENTVISIAGNVDEHVIPLLEQHFSRSNNHNSDASFEAPVFTPQSLFIQKSTEQNHICLSFPGLSMQDPKLYSVVLLNNNIGGGMSSRLFQEIREKRGLAYSVYSYHSSHADSGLFTIYIGTAPKQTEEVLKVTMDIMDEMLAKGISEEELHRGKEQMKGSLILSLESNSSRMNRNGKNELMLGKHYTLDEMVQRIEAVRMEDIKETIQKVLAQPFAAAMVGQSDEAINRVRRDRQ